MISGPRREEPTTCFPLDLVTQALGEDGAAWVMRDRERERERERVREKKKRDSFPFGKLE